MGLYLLQINTSLTHSDLCFIGGKANVTRFQHRQSKSGFENDCKKIIQNEMIFFKCSVIMGVPVKVNAVGWY